MAVLPLVKLGTLAMKTFCKPIANSLKKEAGYHPLFREFIITLAQAHNRVMTRVQRQIYGDTTEVAIRPLDEEKAVKTAAVFLGEFFLFTVAGAAALLELSGSRMKEERRKQELLQAIKAELASTRELHAEKLDQQVELLAQKLAELAQKQAELAQKQAELAQKQAELAQKQAELAQKQEQLAAELVAEFKELRQRATISIILKAN